MTGKESLYPQRWFQKAEQDLRRAHHLLEWGDPSGSAIHLQQAVEKFLKGYLLSKGWKLKRTHNLEALLNEALKHDPSLESYRAACRKISSYYVLERYPLPVPTELTETEIKESLRAAEEIIAQIKTLVQ